MEPSRRTMSGGYANNPPPGMGPPRGGGTQQWSLSNQMNRGEDWPRGSPRNGQQGNVEQWGLGAVGEGRPPSLSSYSWSMSSERGDMAGLSSSPHVDGSLENLEPMRGVDGSNFSTSFSAIFDKMRLSESENRVVQSLDTASAHLINDLDADDNLAYGSLEELELHTIGNLLPDDDDLLAGVVDDYDASQNRREENANNEELEEFDLFSSGGGMELEGDAQDGVGGYASNHRIGDGSGAGQQSGAAGSVAGEHPYGEHPSRTLFVRNINSNVEDTELKQLFEQYGAIRTLYTACKHRGFVMISYYDIRAARSAMRALQNKPLRRRKLDIHFSIPKDNPSDKDVNQGTLVVFNLDASVSNDDLRQIFGAYGEVKEIRETPHKRHHKFIEFYDVRSAEAALRALNRSDIAGKRIKLEPSRPGGARRSSLLQQLNQESGDEDVRSRQQALSPLNTSPPRHASMWSGGGENGAVRGMHATLGYGSFQSPSKPPNSPNLASHMSQPIRVGTIGSHVAQANHMEAAGHSLGHMGGGGHRLPPHPHSLPEFSKGILNPGQFASPGSGASMSSAVGARGREGRESMEVGSRLQRTTGGAGSFGDTSGLEHGSGVRAVLSGGSGLLYPSSNGNGSASGQQFSLWGGSGSSFSHISGSPPPVLWANPSSMGQAFNAIGQTQAQSHAYSSGMLASLSRHHVGSAPSGEPSLLERRHSYMGGESLVESGALMRSSSGTGLGGNAAHAMNIGGGSSQHGVMNMSSSVGGNCGMEHASSPNMGMMSPQNRARFLQNGGVLGTSSIEGLTDRGRSRRGESGSAQADNKKQYQLDLERIMRGEDLRTTLMIKNIPNKYTSKMLLAAIDEQHRGTYDFIYLPIDFKNKCNVGYAFINMTSPARIVPFYKAFNGKKWEKFNSEKVASLAYARIQGKAALVAHFQNSSLMNEDKRCRPILFHSDGPHIGDQVE
nr:protein MEI2-like 5 isoform X2 [Physcomitrium patens]|eukprot:XP_024396738.1 protein MEI2-like 5 isoform X2 [Physcomitrella patens]